MSDGFCIFGVDPGLDGALAVMRSGKPPVVWDTPTLTVKTARGTKREYNLAEIARVVRVEVDLQPAGSILMAGVEAVHAMPGQGVRSMWSMGFGSGIWEMVFAAFRVPLTRIAPQKWQRAMLNGAKGKEGARLRAIQLFPDVSLSRKKDHGRADALLIAEYLRQTAQYDTKGGLNGG